MYVEVGESGGESFCASTKVIHGPMEVYAF